MVLRGLKILSLIGTLVIASNLNLRAQYFLAEEYPVLSSMVLQDQYVPVPDFFFPQTTVMAWDPQAFTRIHVIRDANGNAHHILVQTDGLGNAKFMAYSRSLVSVFERTDKPYFLLQHCLKVMDRGSLPAHVLQHRLKCIVQRLNECAY